jgi:hypothetical protein
MCPVWIYLLTNYEYYRLCVLLGGVGNWHGDSPIPQAAKGAYGGNLSTASGDHGGTIAKHDILL